MTGPILFLIPARGGSVRIPGKNLRTVGGVPLVASAVRIARAAAEEIPGGPHRVVTSTDDPAIAAVASAWGAEVLDRPAALATSTATAVEVGLHALDALSPSASAPSGAGDAFRALVLVQPTSPLTEPADLVAAVALFDRSGGRSVASVTATHPAGWHVTRVGGAEADPAAAPIRRIEVDDAAEVLSGAVYVIAPAELRATGRFVGPDTLGLAIPAERSIDIDTPADLAVAEALAALRPAVAPPPGGPEPLAPDPGVAAAPAGEPRTIAVLTTGRQDWGILHSVARAIRDHPGLRLRLIAGGMHVSGRHGSPIDEIRATGFEPDAVLDWLGDGPADPPADEQAAAALAAVGRELRATPVAALVVAGDRFETAAAALAATIDRVPIVHLHGGEQTAGAFDDALRHAITKQAHLHLVSHPEHAARVIALGEDPATVHIIGTPSLDALLRDDLPDRAALAADLGIALEPPVVVVTVHPATLEPDPAASARAVAAAMDEVPATYVVTLPNADPGAAEVRAALEAAATGPNRVAVAALGERRYWGLLRVADAMLGNSSSGVAEAPALGLPVINVGDRQAGRRRAGAVIDVPAESAAIAAALRAVLAPGVRATSSGGAPGDGRAGERAAHIIALWQPSIPPRKRPIRVDP